MSRKNEQWRKNLVRNCLKECVREPKVTDDMCIQANDPYGLCLTRFEKEKRYRCPIKTREQLLSELHKAAVELLPSLTDPSQQKRCREIIAKTEDDRRCIPKKRQKGRGVEQVDMFATDEWI